MRPSRIIVFWVGVIGLLMFIELAEITHVFTLPVQSAPGYLFSFIFALVFTTILALVGALFIGIWVSSRLRTPTGFSPFEEEMLKMRADLAAVRKELEEMRGRPGADAGNPPPGPPGAPP